MRRESRFFFIHVMKTGGASFRSQILSNFGRAATFPDWRLDGADANTAIAGIDSLADDRLSSIRAYSGHFPYLATTRLEQRLGEPLIRLSLLRDPVERTISLLGDMQRWNDRNAERTTEELYADPMLYAMFIADYQTKLFALEESDRPTSHRHIVDMDQSRLTVAMERLATVDTLGLHSDYESFLGRVESERGWQISDHEDRHVAPSPTIVTDDFRQRIASDNRIDIEFYRFAKDLVAERTER